MTGGRERFEASRWGNFTGIYTPRPLRSAVHPSPVNAAPRISRTALALAPSPILSSLLCVIMLLCCVLCCRLAQAGLTRYASVREATPTQKNGH